MTLTELVSQLERRAAEAEAIGATAPVAAVYRAVVAELSSLAGNGAPTASAPARREEPDRLLTAQDVAQRFHIPVRSVYRRAGGWPFTRRLGPKTLRFSERGLERYLAARRS